MESSTATVETPTSPRGGARVPKPQFGRGRRGGGPRGGSRGRGDGQQGQARGAGEQGAGRKQPRPQASTARPRRMQEDVRNDPHLYEPELREQPVSLGARMKGLEINGNSQSDAAAVDDSEVEVCFICASPVVHHSVAPCNHRTCHICALRLRALYKTNACAHCRVRVILFLYYLHKTHQYVGRLQPILSSSRTIQTRTTRSSTTQDSKSTMTTSGSSTRKTTFSRTQS